MAVVLSCVGVDVCWINYSRNLNIASRAELNIMLFRLQLSIRKLRSPEGPVPARQENHMHAYQTVQQHMHMLRISSLTKYRTGPKIGKG